MGTRKNAKFLTAAEREAFVRACVSMKADIVNPGAAAAQQYSRWDEYVAIHQMIQNATAPGVVGNVNFGHGGSGSYAFLSWHRYFLVQFELQLQSYVPGVMMPYWDWTDPAVTMNETFLGPNGGVGQVVRRGYFAVDAPGTGGNPTLAPAWWPVGLVGWRLPIVFGSTWAGGLRRNLSGVASLPSVADLRTTLGQATYAGFQGALESGAGLASGNQMHNGMHGWIGGHMGSPAASPLDPLFYLHHCNIDRLWAMWQLDGHADEYPVTSTRPMHGRNDVMYPWVGGAAGFGTNAAIATSVPMPNVVALGSQRNVDTLDMRAYGYTYDTLPIIGIGLDRTGSMNGITPDPMTTSAPDVTKWEAARRGVSAFLQDCQTVQNSALTYVTAGVKTFRSFGAVNEFAPVFPAPGYGLIKSGTPFSRTTFDSTAGAMTAAGGTPLADALLDVEATVAEAPAGGQPSDEQRYVAMLTDGMLTSGAPLASIADGSLGRTAVFAMGFGTGVDVDYPTLAALVAKGRGLSTNQVFHGENAGTIDKFYSEALAGAIGFTTVIDPVVELFAGEHTHIDFWATSAEDAFVLTAQGMDFHDDNWAFTLHGPDGLVFYTDQIGHADGHKTGHDGHCGCPCRVDVTAMRGRGRLSLVVQRDSAEAHCWVGQWRLMVSYKARNMDAMVMLDLGELVAPVAAGPTRGPRFARLLVAPRERTATRNIATNPANRIDSMPPSTNNNDQSACSAVISITARTRLRISLLPAEAITGIGEEQKFKVEADVLNGAVLIDRSIGRSIGPRIDLAQAVARVVKDKIPRGVIVRKGDRDGLPFDATGLLARLEAADAKLARLADVEVDVVSHDGALSYVQLEAVKVAGARHLGIYLEGRYCPDHDATGGGHDRIGADDGHADHDAEHPGGRDDACPLETFTRILTASNAVVRKRR